MRRNIWSLSNFNGTRTQNHFVGKTTLNHLPEMAKWLSRVVSNYLYSVFDWMFFSGHVRTSEWTHTL